MQTLDVSLRVILQWTRDDDEASKGQLLLNIIPFQSMHLQSQNIHVIYTTTHIYKI